MQTGEKLSSDDNIGLMVEEEGGEEKVQEKKTLVVAVQGSPAEVPPPDSDAGREFQEFLGFLEPDTNVEKNAPLALVSPTNFLSFDYNSMGLIFTQPSSALVNEASTTTTTKNQTNQKRDRREGEKEEASTSPRKKRQRRRATPKAEQQAQVNASPNSNESSEDEASCRESVASKEGKGNSSWTDEEKAKLMKAVEEFGARLWKEIAKRVGTKNHKQCRSHYNLMGNKTGRFTKDEDELLETLVAEQISSPSSSGKINWSRLQEKWVKVRHEKRGGKNLREHWLTMKSNKDQFTAEEDEIVLRGDELVWAEVGHLLKGRTYDQARSRRRVLLNQKTKNTN